MCVCVRVRVCVCSAVDQHSVRYLYDPPGPSVRDETLEYAPPEVLFGDGVPCSAIRPQVLFTRKLRFRRSAI